MEESERITLNIRIIRSFEYRNIRNVILKEVPITITTDELCQLINQQLLTSPGLPPPVRKYSYDTLKIEHHAHGAKTNDPCINRDNDEELILKPQASLKDSGVRNETELSYFKMNDFMAYKENPILKWN